MGKIVEANEIFPILGKLLRGQLKRAKNQALYGFRDGEDLFGSEFFELARNVENLPTCRLLSRSLPAPNQKQFDSIDDV